MNIVREDIDALNATLKVVVSPKDYESKVSNALIKYSKTAKIPGFRDGKIPMGMIKKQYGKGVLSEELNRFVNESLHNYITENKIDILGNPIPSEANGFKGDFEKPTEFEFTYDIGLVPDIKVALSSKNKFNYYKVKVDKKLIEKQTEDLRRRYGKLVSVGEVGEKDMILAQFVELNEDQSIKEAGVLHSSTISMEFVEDQKTTKELLGKKVGDKVIVDPAKVSKGGKDTAAMLGVKEDELNDLSNEFQMTITEIKFAYGKEYKEEESIMTDDYFTEDQNMVLSLSMSSMLFDAIIISFDKAIDPKSGFQITGKLLGIGFGPSFENWYNRSGFDLEVGYKLKFSGLKKKKWEYRPNHLLSGRYIMPSVGFTTYSEDRSSSQIKKNLIHLGLKFGNLKIIQKLIIVDYYTGFAYFGGSKKRTLNSYGSDVDFEYNDINAGDLLGSGNFAVTFGFKVGLAFGQYGEQKEKLKRRK